MPKSVVISVRAHTEVLKRSKGRTQPRTAVKKGVPSADQVRAIPKWPESVLVFDCETTTDERQTLTFGSYRFCRANSKGAYVCVEEGLFHGDELEDPAELATLQQFAQDVSADSYEGGQPRLRLLSRSQFIERVFWPALLDADAMLVGFNLPFDISRIAFDCRNARKRDEGWSFVMSRDTDPVTGQPRDNPFRPRIRIRPKDSKAAFIELTGVSIINKRKNKRFKPFKRGRFLDLRTLGWALRSVPYGLDSACDAFGVTGKLDHEPTGRISRKEIEYCREDVRATVDLLNAMRCEFDQHPIDLHPDRAYSPASIAKAYLKQMGLTPPSEKFDLPIQVVAASMQAYYGGRAECRIRHTVVPVIHTDFVSQYPTVNLLMGLWPLLIAEHLNTEDATDSVRELLARVTPEMVFHPESWEQFRFFALVKPEHDILPVRTPYNGKTNNIGVNPVTSEPLWYAGPDLIAATLLGNRPPKIIRAFRLVPEGQQSGLKPVALGGMVPIDPRVDDFFQVVIENKQLAKHDTRLTEVRRKALSYFLKILANAGSYGLFVEVNPRRSLSGERDELAIFSGDRAFKTTSAISELPGSWYCPPIAALITAAGRLLLALLEREVQDRGGSYLMCDTDSMAIVASEAGGLVPCVAGTQRLPDGREAITLRREDVKEIVRKFEQLNLYDREAVSGSILKIERGEHDDIFGYAIATKRYALFSRTAAGIRVEKASAHGLGFLHVPLGKDGFDDEAEAPVWVVEAWEWILRPVLGLEAAEPSWFDTPAMMKFTITTPEVLKVLQARQMMLPYSNRAKPFNFIQSPLINEFGGHPSGCDPKHFTLIAPFSSNPSQWRKRLYVNTHDGKSYRLARPGRRLASEAEPQTRGDVVSRYRWHPEAKSLAPDGNACKADTTGLLLRMPITVVGLSCIGKETNRRWEQGDDISILTSEVLEYSPNESARLVADPELKAACQLVSIRVLAAKADVSENTVKAARRGDRLRKSTADKLRRALKEVL